MIQTLARKRTQLGALTVLAGLVVALFAVFQMTSAAPAVVISLNDSDNVVKDGAGYEVHVRVLDGTDAAGSTDYRLEYIVVSSGVFLTGDQSGQALEATVTTADAEATLVVPKGAAGTYTITAGVATPATGDVTGRMVGSLVVTVGDVGTPVGSVEVVLGKVGHVADAATDKDTKPFGTAAENTIAVTVNVFNSLGNKTNDGEVSQVILFAPTGQAGEGATADTPNSDSVSGDAAGASNNFSVNKTTAGTVSVTALAIGTDGSSATSGTLTLTFTGTATTLVLGDPSGPLPVRTTPDDANTADVNESTQVTVDVTATDDAGNKAALPVANLAETAVTFVDANDDSVANTVIIPATAQKPAPTTAEPTATDPNSVRITISTADAKPGSYTMKVAFGTGGAGSAEATIIVADKPASVELTSEQAEGSSIVTVTATVTDKDGNLVPNIHSVDFVNVGSLNLVALDDEDAMAAGAQRATKNGAASVRYVITGGSGSATVIATVAAGVDAVLVISGPDAADEADDTPSLSDFSRLSGLASYTGPDAQASELMALLAGRATAIWLSSGDGWVLYASADGAMVPGSENFTATSGDVIYISN